MLVELPGHGVLARHGRATDFVVRRHLLPQHPSLSVCRADVATVSKTEEQKKRYGAKERMITSVLEASSSASGAALLSARDGGGVGSGGSQTLACWMGLSFSASALPMRLFTLVDSSGGSLLK